MEQEKIKYITLLSGISCLAVVFLHVNGCFWNFSTNRYWFTANIIECIFYFAVPIFFMITGATLLDYQKKYSTKEFFKKRTKKVFIPFIAWSIIGLLYLNFIKKSINIFEMDFKNIIDGIINSKFITIYWFFPSIICTYLSIPLLASVEENKKKNIYKYLVVMGFILNSLIPFLNDSLNLNFSFYYNIAVSSGYLIFLLIGYLINRYEINKLTRILIYIFGVLGLLMHIVFTYILSINAGMIIKTFKGYTNIPSILYSTAVFTFFKYNFKKINERIIKLFDKLSNYTFSIYLLHFYVIDLLVLIFKINTKSIIYRIFMPFIIVSICIFITKILRKIKIIKEIVPT